jgi:hypothetical protein
MVYSCFDHLDIERLIRRFIGEFEFEHRHGPEIPRVQFDLFVLDSSLDVLPQTTHVRGDGIVAAWSTEALNQLTPHPNVVDCSSPKWINNLITALKRQERL